MYFSAKLIEELVIDLAELNQLNTESLSNLIFHLKLPGDEVPLTIAQVIARRPVASEPASRLPGRLAYGVVDDCLALYDVGERNRQQARLCRQVNRIRLRLEQMERPVHIIDSFEEKLALLVFAAASVRDIADNERRPTDSELVVLVEQLLYSALVQAELTKLLLERIVAGLRPSERSSLALRVGTAIRDGLEEKEDSVDEESLLSLAKAPLFRASLRQDPAFAEAAWDTLRQISALAGTDKGSARC